MYDSPLEKLTLSTNILVNIFRLWGEDVLQILIAACKLHHSEVFDPSGKYLCLYLYLYLYGVTRIVDTDRLL